MRNDNGSGSMLAAFMLGALAGAAVALLYAPAAGDETRRRLGEKAREGRDKAGEYARRGREAAEDLARRGREAYDSAVGKETL
jgi:gas vesicle protein